MSGHAHNNLPVIIWIEIQPQPPTLVHYYFFHIKYKDKRGPQELPYPQIPGLEYPMKVPQTNFWQKTDQPL